MVAPLRQANGPSAGGKVRREITIELNFAPSIWDPAGIAGVVDVHGHEDLSVPCGRASESIWCSSWLPPT